MKTAVKLSSIDSIFVLKSKGWLKGRDFAELFETVTLHHADAYSQYHIYYMLIHTCEKILTPRELCFVIKNPASDLMIDRKKFEEKYICHEHLFLKMLDALSTVDSARYVLKVLPDEIQKQYEVERNGGALNEKF